MYFFSNPLLVLTVVILSVMVLQLIMSNMPKTVAAGDRQTSSKATLITALKVRMGAQYVIAIAVVIAFLDPFWSSVLLWCAGIVLAASVAYFHWAVRIVDRDNK
jgi:hypothetical protein